MRRVLFLVLFVPALFMLAVLMPAMAHAQVVGAISDDEAKIALKEFKSEFRKAKSLEARQELVFSLHDIPSDKVIKALKKLIRHKDEGIRVVAALALGGQSHNKKAAGKLLMETFERDKKVVDVAISCIDGMKELRFFGYWPQLKESAGRKGRSAVVIRILELIGANKDYRALPMLLEMYKVSMPKRVTWKTGTVNVDTGASGDADNQAAKAAFNKKYGAGGSKEKSKAAAKARSFDARNFTTQIRACAKAVTGEDFETDFDLEDWWVDNYEKVARKIAEMNGEDVEKAVKKAMKELPARKKEIEEDRRKIENEIADAEKKNKKKRKK